MKRLMLAVMEDALRCFQRYAERPSSHNRKALPQAEAWISDRHAEGPFAFRNICETLGIPPDSLRRGIRQWRIQVDSLNPRRIGPRSMSRSQPTAPPARRRRIEQNEEAKADTRLAVEKPS